MLWAVLDEDAVDRHLGSVIDQVISAIQETKQAVWSASTTEKRAELNELKSFLGEQLMVLCDAEERINGRARDITCPTGHPIRNLWSEAGNDFTAFKALVLGELRGVAEDARQRAEDIAGAPEADLLTGLADGLERRVVALADD
jgi:hypothetical protein